MMATSRQAYLEHHSWSPLLCHSLWHTQRHLWWCYSQQYLLLEQFFYNRKITIKT